MEKDQVTFAVQASGLKGPVGRPVLILCEALQAAPQQFVWIRGGPSHTSEVTRYIVPEGPLSAYHVGLIEEITVRELFGALSFWKGVQAEFETLP